MKAAYLKIFILLLCLHSAAILYAQVPVIYSVDKYVNSPGAKVTIIGTNFGTDATKLVVNFGGVNGTIIPPVTNEVLEVNAPSGTTFDKVSITNITTGLTVYSDNQFLLSYGGDHPLLSSGFQSQIDFPTLAPTGLYDLCLCDLDGDKKIDIASTSSDANLITLFRNTSLPGTPNFTRASINLGSGLRSLNIRCGDLNGDGKKDLVISETGGNRIFIFKNNSTPGTFSFTAPQNIALSGGKKPTRIEISDLDLDGKPELIISDQGTNSDLLVLANTSSLAAISFAPFKTITVTNAASTGGLAVEDINGDHLPDIIVNQFLTATSNIFILKNNSTPGNIKFDNQVMINAPGTLVNVRVGDLDGDGIPDIAGTQLLPNYGISVFLNKTSNGSVSFSSVTDIPTDDRPWGIDFSDLDGDGKNDIVVASVTNKSLTVLNNESSPGSLSFKKTILSTTFINRHIQIGDIDGDSKPDIAFTSIDDTNSTPVVIASKVSVIRNKNCMTPKVTPAGPLSVCAGFNLKLNSTESLGATYQWKIGGTTIPSATTPVQNVTASGLYTVTLTAEGGSCIRTSNPVVNAIVITSSTAVPPVFNTNSPVCLSDKMQIKISNSTGADIFEWTGPAGFTGTGSSIERPDFKIEYAGRYYVDAKITVSPGVSCIAAQGSQIISAVSTPDFKVNFSSSNLVCTGDTRALTVSPADPSFTYQWFEKTKGLIAGAVTSSYSAIESGQYFFKAQSTAYPGCQAVQSNEAAIIFVTPPVVAFTAPTEACKDKPVPFTNQSTSDSNATPVYSWNFGDSQTSTDTSPSHIFSTVQTFNVKLSASYSGGICPAELTKPVKISLAPTASITTAGNVFKLCPDSNLKLEVNGTFATYLWNTTETTPSIVVNKAGSYTVDVSNGAGCTAKATRQVDAVDAPKVTVTAVPDFILAGETSQLTASGLIDYDWNHGKILSDSTISNPVATPTETTILTVTGKGTNGCPGEATIEIKVKGDATVNRLKPSNFFSPNGDAVNSFWTVDNILTFPQCGVNIYDDKGIKVFESKPYINNWDGTFKGSALPNGVYFYIIRCDGEEGTPRSGSITLLR